MKGSKLPVVEKVITQEQLARYAHASGDHNPLHLDPEFASATQFGGVIAHGMLTLAFVSEMLTSAFGQSWLESGRLKVRLKAPAYPGDRVHTWGEVVKDEPGTQERSIECSVGLVNSRGQELISGVASVTQRI
jgi:3-hydroxybutyryl-CoA dehydratase